MSIPVTRSAAAQKLSPTELRAWRGMLRVHSRLVKALDAQLEHDHALPLTSYEVLLRLGDAEGQRMRMCDLADSILLSRSGLTRLVDRLEREGLLVRVACDDDARGSYAKLTPDGRAKLDASRATHLDGVRSLFIDHISDEELETLGRLWDRLIPNDPDLTHTD
jgi:DNA-binding MarR family transcriptional regulator